MTPFEKVQSYNSLGKLKESQAAVNLEDIISEQRALIETLE